MTRNVSMWADELVDGHYPYPEWILSPTDFQELARLFYADRGLPWDTRPGVRYRRQRLRDPEPGGPVLLSSVLTAAVRAIPVTSPERATSTP